MLKKKWPNYHPPAAPYDAVKLRRRKLFKAEKFLCVDFGQ